MNYELNANYIIEIKIKDPEENFILLNVTVRIEDINEIPIFSNLPAVINITEDTRKFTRLYSLEALDEDNDNITFKMILTDKTFGIFPNGTISLLRNLDYETKNEYKLNFVVTDGQLNTSSYLIINIIDVNESPTFQGISPKNLSVNENFIGSIFIVSAIDHDFNDSLNYNITIFPKTSSIFINQQGNIQSNGLDYELIQSYQLDIFIYDKAGLSIQTNLTVNVVDLQEPPSIINLPITIPCLLENLTNDTIIYTVNSTDPEKDVVDYSLLSSTEKFAIHRESINE